VYVARSRNSFLFLVVALDQGVSGGCVLIKGIKFDDQEIRGAGRVSTVLGFDEHGLTGRIKETDSSGLELQVDGILSPGTVASSGMPAEKPAAAEQLPSSVLQQYLGQITTRFTEEATPDESFDNYLSRIATDHPTEAELRAWLDS